MPGRKNRRKYANSDWEVSETDESYTNSHNNNIADLADTGGASEHRNSNGNSFTNSHVDGARYYQGKVSNSFQQKHKVVLGPWTIAVGETLQRLKETQRTINTLQTVFMLHANDLERVDETRKMLHQLEEVCKQKDKEMESQEETIRTLTRMENKAKAKLEQEAEQIKKERNELKQEKEKQDKRFTVAAAEEKIKVIQEVEKLTIQHEETYEKRKQELEEEFAQKRDENNRIAAVFEAERERLSTSVKEQELQIKAQAQELKKIKVQYDVLERATNSIRKEKEDREADLEAVKKEFALDPPPTKYIMDGFAKIEGQIEAISGKYFHSTKGKDAGQVHKELAEADPHFEPVPIDDSEDSHDLCTAHAQRIISKAICEDIWKPFSSEFIALQPEFSSVLGKISDEIGQSDQGGRTSKFWNARTMRALKSLAADSVTSRDSESTVCRHPVRTDSIISKVFVLSPLLDSSLEESLRMDLVKLVNSAVDVWDHSQASGSKITVSLLLDHVQREQWRSEQFDPACEDDGTIPDLTSTTNSRIFALFPRVLAPGVEDSVNQGNGLPGSWPADSNPIVIHPGKGLPDWSQLVLRGQDAQEEKRDILREAVENAKKKMQNTKRGPANGRRASRGSVSSGSPSEQYKRLGATEFTEK